MASLFLTRDLLVFDPELSAARSAEKSYDDII